MNDMIHPHAGAKFVSAEEAPMIVFTICSRNFLGYAQTLWDSLRQTHPNVIFHVGLCDEEGDCDLLTHPFEFIRISELGIQRWDEMVSRYDITELNTALKPFIFLLLFSRYPGQPIFYIDPDILAFSTFDEVFAQLESGANCVLTPHVNGPSEFSEMNDQQFLRYGVYNMGFCVLRGVPEVRRVVSWWARRLETQCVVDLENGLFVDQKWADLFPAYIEKTAILRHPGYNVAYWNLAQRLVRQDEDGIWRVNGERLRFFHFSGNKIEKEDEFSRHSEVFTVDTIGDVRKLLKIYRNAVQGGGHAYYRGIPYAFNWGHDGRKNVHTPSSVEAERRANASRTPHLPVEILAEGSEIDSRAPLPVWAAQRQMIDQRIRAEVIGDAVIEGFCAVCNAPSRFRDEGMLIEAANPNWGRSLVCECCHSPSHVRAAAKLLGQTNAVPATSRVQVDHQALLDCEWLREAADVRSLGGKNDLASLTVLCGESVDTDLQDSLVQAFEAMEPGGYLLLSPTGFTEGLLPETVAPESLLAQAGFVECKSLLYWSERLCHFGDPQVMMTARKPVAVSRR